MPYWDGISKQAAPWYETLSDKDEEKAPNSEAVIVSGGGWGLGAPPSGTFTGPQTYSAPLAEDPVAAKMTDPTEVAPVPEGVVTPPDDIPVPRRTIRSEQDNSSQKSAEDPVVELALEATPVSAPAPPAVVGTAPAARRTSPAHPTSAITGAQELPSARVVNPPWQLPPGSLPSRCQPLRRPSAT